MKKVKTFFVDGIEVDEKDYQKAFEDELHSHDLQIKHIVEPETLEEKYAELQCKYDQLQSKVEDLEKRVSALEIYKDINPPTQTSPTQTSPTTINTPGRIIPPWIGDGPYPGYPNIIYCTTVSKPNYRNENC